MASRQILCKSVTTFLLDVLHREKSFCKTFCEVFASFSKFSDVFGPIWIHSDLLGRIRMHSDALRCIPMQGSSTLLNDGRAGRASRQILRKSVTTFLVDVCV